MEPLYSVTNPQAAQSSRREKHQATRPGRQAIFTSISIKTAVILYTNKPKAKLKLISKTEVDLPAFTTASLHHYNRAYTYTGANKSKFNNLIADAASRHRVDEKLLHAVIQTESAYNSNAISPAGAVGLMQLMPATARRFGVMDRNDPDQNVDGGARYLKYLIGLFGPYNLDLAVAAYNAGENAVMKYNNSIPPYPETRQLCETGFSFV